MVRQAGIGAGGPLLGFHLKMWDTRAMSQGCLQVAKVQLYAKDELSMNLCAPNRRPAPPRTAPTTLNPPQPFPPPRVTPLAIMSLLSPSTLTFSLSELDRHFAITVEQFCLDFKGGDADADRMREVMSAYLDFAKMKNRALKETSEAR